MNSPTGSWSVYSASARLLLRPTLTEGTTLLPDVKDILIVLPGSPHPDITPPAFPSTTTTTTFSSSSSSSSSSSTSTVTCRDSL